MVITSTAMSRAKEEIINHLIWWVDAAKSKGQSPMPLHFDSLVVDDCTLHDMVEIARGKS